LIETGALHERELAELALGPSALAQAVPIERFRSEWSDFLRPDDVLATWNTNARAALNDAAGRAGRGVALKSAYHALGRDPGSLEEIVRREAAASGAYAGIEMRASAGGACGTGRPGRRLAHALWLAEFLHRQALP
jgi:hypothetical protein